MILYTQPTCGQCRVVHMFLDNNKITYTECQDIEAMKAKGIFDTPTLELDDGTLIKKAKPIMEYIKGLN